MNRLSMLLSLTLLGLPASAQWNYPPTRTVPIADTYFGKTYPDPFRWLEDLKDREVASWFQAQASLTDGLLARIPGRDALVREWQGLDKIQPQQSGRFTFRNGRLFYRKLLSGENRVKLYCREGWDGPERLLFDPATYQAGTHTVIQSTTTSMDGKFIVLGLSAKGAEWSELRILDVDHGTLLPERISPSLGASEWTPDGKGFFYDAGKVTDLHALDLKLDRQVRLHLLGTRVAADRVILSREHDPDLKIIPREHPVIETSPFIPDTLFAAVVTVEKDLRILYSPLAALGQERMPWKVLSEPSDQLVDFVAGSDCIYAVTHTGAPHYKVVRTSLERPDWGHAETVVPEAADSIQYIIRCKDYMFVVYSDGVSGRILKVDLATGQAQPVPLPVAGDVGVAVPDPLSNRCLIGLTSWTMPLIRFDYDASTGTLAKSAFSTDAVYPGFENLVAEEVVAPAKDGTMIPLSIIHRKGLPLDGSSCCILSGYGAYGSSSLPDFDLENSLALRDVVLAIAHVRGGGEKGEAWYKAGYKTTNPTTWNDFIACAEFLVKQGYSSPARLACTGTSAGGILISRAITERPDLFAAAVCNVGCANALRLEFSPNGPGNIPEFGTVKDPAECAALAEMDGVLHVRPDVKFPAVLGVTGWNDPRVSPWQPGKFVAALQKASVSGRPVLLKVNYDSGHHSQEKDVVFKDAASRVAFLLWQTGHKDFQPVP